MEAVGPTTTAAAPAPQKAVLSSDACWPDHVAPGIIELDDVSQMSRQRVSHLIMPQEQSDVFEALELALSQGLQVSVRGTKHSMGGHSLAAGGIVLDMGYVNHINYDEGTELVTVGSGALWSDVIVALNEYGRAPRTLQSYCTFSVGGSLSVNAHGITSDYALAESVVGATILTLNGNGERVLAKCVRDAGDDNAVLFRHAIGGYGLFGVIYDVTMRVAKNTSVIMETLQLSPVDFPHVYTGVLCADDVAIKLARIDITNFDWIALYVFKERGRVATVSDLAVTPREMSPLSRLFFKWLAGPLQELRFAAERQFGLALDWAPVSDRNSLVYENASPVGRLYSPLLQFDDTFVLQEYFVPAAAFGRFYGELKRIVKGEIQKETLITLLNTTIRFVRRDAYSALPYARVESFAFVLYYRLRRTSEAEAVLHKYHTALADCAIMLDGTFYLPYRHHYSDAQLRAAYPEFADFVSAKQRLDPLNLFGNTWWRRYGSGSAEVARRPGRVIVAAPAVTTDWASVSVHRSDSFRKLFLHMPAARQLFRAEFLVDTFNLMSPAKLYSIIMNCMYDPRTNVSDAEVYEALLSRVKAEQTGAVAQFFFLAANIKQLSAQRAELTRETLSIMARLGRVGTLHDYCSIGDHGKLVLSLRRALRMGGAVTVVNDNQGSSEDIACVLERCSLEPVGAFCKIDFAQLLRREFPTLADESFDLVTMMQGLHHLPPTQLVHFLQGVERILRPGGLFIIREHDMADESLRPVLDCAHSVFNAVTGVPAISERHEIRGFRSLLEWRHLVESSGQLKDTRVYEMQPHDCTKDVMMVFQKVGAPRAREGAPVAMAESAANRVAAALPKIALDAGMGLVNSLLRTLPDLRKFLLGAVTAVLPNVPGVTTAISARVQETIDGWLAILERFQPLADMASPVSGNSDGSSAPMIPDEVYLLIPVLRLRAKKGGVLEAVLIDGYDKIVAGMSAESSANQQPQPAAGSAAPPATAASHAVLEADFDAEVQRLVAAVPTLQDPERAIRDAGLPPKAADLLVAAFTSENAAKLRLWAIHNLDARSWAQIRAAAARVRAQPAPPTMAGLLQSDSPWNALALAVLGAPALQLSWAQSVGMTTMGMGQLVELYQTAQSKYRRDTAKDPGLLPPDAQQKLKESLDRFSSVVSKEMSLGAGQLTDIAGVLCVESAMLHALSLTRLLSDTVSDVTPQVCEMLDAQSGTLQLSQLKLPATWRAGKHKLVVTYRRQPVVQSAADFAPLVEHLHALRVYDGDFRKENTSFTYLKLPEWMLAELVSLMGSTMDHTPFYRFPYMQALRLYLKVLIKETRLVANRTGGFVKTLFSDAFITDFVGAIIVSLGFGALQLVSLPIKMVTGENYPKDSEMEVLLVTAPRNVPWAQLCGAQNVLRAQEITAGVHVLTVPTFKGFTRALLAIAQHVPSCTVLSVSNNHVVQVRLSLVRPENASHFLALPGCSPAVTFAYPPVGGHVNATQLCMSVDTPQLLQVLRAVQRVPHMATVYQVYDMFKYEVLPGSALPK